MANEWKRVGQVKESQKGTIYLSLDENIELGPDRSVILQDPRAELEKSVKAGRLEEEKALAIAAKIPDFVLYNVVLPPPRS